MTPISKTLTGLLEVGDPILKKLRGTILRSFDEPDALNPLLFQQCENRDQAHCLSCEHEGICSFLNGVLYFRLGKIADAIAKLEDASQHFREQGETWNAVAAQSMLGVAYEEIGNHHRALIEYHQALEMLTDDFIRMHSTEYIEKARIVQNLLHDQIECCVPPKTSAQRSKAVSKSARLTIPWMNRYSGLSANPKGPVRGEPLLPKDSVLVDEIILDDKPHRIFSLRQGDRLITLVKGRKYGWAKVVGDSMNGAKPVAIMEDDFVLYYESNDAEHRAIVVVNYPDEQGSGSQDVVKRFSKNDRLLLSETDPPGLYEPMPINRNVKIMGVVIAVAKPDDGSEVDSGGEQDAPKPHGGSRYAELVGLLQGDAPAAERLIALEKSLSLGSSREECIERAIARLLRDRRA